MTDARSRAREIALQRYLDALDDGDLETLAALLRLAERDPQFEHMIVDAHGSIDLRTDTSLNGHVQEPKEVMMQLTLQKPRHARAWLPLLAALFAVIIAVALLYTRMPQRVPIVAAPPSPTPLQSVISPQNAKSLEIVHILGSGEFNGAVAWSPDGTLALASGDTVIFALGAQGAAPPNDDNPNNFVTALAYSADGTMLAIGRRSGKVSLWDVKAQSIVRELSGDHPVTQVTFSADSDILGVTYQDAVIFWQVSDGLNLIHVPHMHSLGVVMLGAKPFLVLEPTKASVYNTNSGNTTFVAPGGVFDTPIMAMAGDGSKGQIVLGYEDGTVKLWDSFQSTVKTLMTAKGSAVDHLGFDSTHQLIAVAAAGSVNIVHADTGTVSLTLDIMDAGTITGLAFSPSGDAIAVTRQDGSARVYDIPGGEEVTRLGSGKGGWLENAIFSPDGKSLLVRDSEHLEVWDVASQQLTHTFDGTAPWAGIAFAPDGKLVASLAYDGVTLLDPTTGKVVRTLAFSGDNTNPVPGDGGDARSAAVTFSPDGSLIAAGRIDGAIFLWNTSTGALMRTIAAQRTLVYGLDFSPDGTLIAASSGSSVGTDPLVRIFDVQSGKRLQTFKGYGDYDEVWRVAYNPDGSRLATLGGSNNADLIVWNAATGEQIFKRPMTAPGLALAYSPDGQLIATSFGSESLRLIDAVTGNDVATLPAPGVVTGVSWSANGELLAVTSTNGPVVLWGLPK